MATDITAPSFLPLAFGGENQTAGFKQPLHEQSQMGAGRETRKRIGALGDHVGGRYEGCSFGAQGGESGGGCGVPLVAHIPKRNQAHAIEENRLHRWSSSTRAASSGCPS